MESGARLCFKGGSKARQAWKDQPLSNGILWRICCCQQVEHVMPGALSLHQACSGLHAYRWFHAARRQSLMPEGSYQEARLGWCAHSKDSALRPGLLLVQRRQRATRSISPASWCLAAGSCSRFQPDSAPGLADCASSLPL